VQVYGVVDMAVSNYRGAGAGSRQMLTSSGNQASRLGFKGREDLGSGLAAGFDLEAGLNTDNGTGQASNTNNQPSGAGSSNGLSFNRKALVYLQSKQWGEYAWAATMCPPSGTCSTTTPFAWAWA
jgi:predicted porin